MPGIERSPDNRDPSRKVQIALYAVGLALLTLLLVVVGPIADHFFSATWPDLQSRSLLWLSDLSKSEWIALASTIIAGMSTLISLAALNVASKANQKAIASSNNLDPDVFLRIHDHRLQLHNASDRTIWHIAIVGQTGTHYHDRLMVEANETASWPWDEGAERGPIATFVHARSRYRAYTNGDPTRYPIN